MTASFPKSNDSCYCKSFNC